MAKVNGKDIIEKLAEKSKGANVKEINLDIAPNRKVSINKDADVIKNVNVNSNATVEGKGRNNNLLSIKSETPKADTEMTTRGVNTNVSNASEDKLNADVIKAEVVDNLSLDYVELLAMAHKTREYKMIYAMEVYVNDDFKYEYGLRPILKHKPAVKPKGKPVFYYAVCRHRTGAIDFKVVPRTSLINDLVEEENMSEIDIKKLSDKELDFMAKKIVLKTIINNNGGLK